MKINSGGRDLSLCFMTPTWGRDLGHFRWLRRSLERSGLADVPHVVIVQTEDVDLFRPYVTGGVKLMATADVLPADVERGRVIAMARAQRYGRALTKLCTSLNKRFGWCKWVKYSGWHVQQITKFQAAANNPYDITVVLDSDLLITRPFDLKLFAPDGRVAVFENYYLTPQTPGLGWKWHQTASHLLKQPITPDRPANGYWAPPFVFDRVTTQSLHKWIEAEYSRPWYQVLLAQPPYGWSEGRIYSLFARAYGDASLLSFVGNPHLRGVATKEDRRDMESIIREALCDPQTFFMFIQSDQRAQKRFSVGMYEPILSKYFLLPNEMVAPVALNHGG